MTVPFHGDTLRSELLRELAGIPMGTHACILYDDTEQLLAVTVPYLRLGLERNERCLCLSQPETAEAIAAALAADGVDVEGEIRRGALTITSERPHLVGGAFDPDAMVEALRRAGAQALADGFTGLRATGDMAWELGPDCDFGLIPPYESKLDLAFLGSPLVGLCQYRRQDYPVEVLRDALRTHPVVSLGTQLVTSNPYHEPAALLWPKDVIAAEAGRMEWMAASLRKAAEARRTVDALVSATRDRLALVLEGMSDAFLALDRDWRITYANAEAVRLSNLPRDRLVGALIWDLCPEGAQGDTAREFRRAVADQVAVHFEHRQLNGGVERWLDISATPSPEGLNVFYRDISECKRSDERQRLLMREVDHRAKNALAVAQSIVMLTRADTMPAFVAAVEGRIAALARVHTLLARGKWSGADLRDIVGEELAPYGTGVRLTGPAVRIAADAAQPAAMVLHELATNAAKYGALSVRGGRVEVAWTALPEGGLRLDWRESGGPAVTAPARQGFGSRMIAMAVSGQLGGSSEFDWRSDGLRCAITLSASQLASNPPEPPRGGMTAASSGQAVSLEGMRILLVEDDSLLAMGVQFALESLGCQVVGPAATLEAALGLAASEPLDAAVLDVNLRGRESWTVADVLAARGVPHIFTTGYGDIGEQAAARGAKVLVKPFHPSQLAPALRAVLGGG